MIHAQDDLPTPPELRDRAVSFRKSGLRADSLCFSYTGLYRKNIGNPLSNQTPETKMLYLGAQVELEAHFGYVTSYFEPYKSIRVEIKSIGAL